MSIEVNGQQNSNKKLTQKEKDKLYLKQPAIDFMATFKKPFQGRLKGFLNKFNKNNILVVGAANYANQTILSNNYLSVYNYSLTDLNENYFKLGWVSGLRINGSYDDNNKYIFEILFRNINTGTYYTQPNKILPYYIGDYSNFKAENKFLYLNISSLYKKELLHFDLGKSNISFVIGPSFEIRLNEQHNDNLLHNNYKRFVLNGKVGVELESADNYTLFVHYIRNITPITNTPIKVNLNNFEIGAALKFNKIF